MPSCCKGRGLSAWTRDRTYNELPHGLSQRRRFETFLPHPRRVHACERRCRICVRRRFLHLWLFRGLLPKSVSIAEAESAPSARTGVTLESQQKEKGIFGGWLCFFYHSPLLLARSLLLRRWHVLFFSWLSDCTAWLSGAVGFLFARLSLQVDKR